MLPGDNLNPITIMPVNNRCSTGHYPPNSFSMGYDHAGHVAAPGPTIRRNTFNRRTQMRRMVIKSTLRNIDRRSINILTGYRQRRFLQREPKTACCANTGDCLCGSLQVSCAMKAGHREISFNMFT